MITVEAITANSLNALMYDVAIIGILLVIATVIRLKVGFLRKAFIPASLIAGLMGLALGPYGLKAIPKDMMTSMSRLPTQMIIVVFACMFLGQKKKTLNQEYTKEIAASVIWTWSASFQQFFIPCLLAATIFSSINPLFGCLFEVGFAGGHGTASGMATMFKETFLWADGVDLATTTATIGLLAGIFGGIALINYAVRHKYTKVLTTKASANNQQEVFDEGTRKANAYGTISQDVIEPFAFHVGIIGAAIILGRFIVWGVGKITGYGSLPLFPFCMIGGWILNGIIQKTSFADYLDRNTFQRIQGICLEILIVGAMASIKVPVIIKYWFPLLLTSVIILVVLFFWMFKVCPHIFAHDWFELAITHFGVKTGVAAVGYMLLRTSDPEMKTEAGSLYALGTPFTSAFIGGGLVTSAIPYMIDSMGALKVGLIFLALNIVTFIVLRLFFWDKNAKPEQR